MKVLNIIPKGLRSDGISSIVLDYYKQLIKQDISIDFLGSEISSNAKELLNDNRSTFYCLENRISNTISYFINLKRIIKKNNYDIVHIHGSSTILSLELLAAKMAGCKIRIVHSHNTKTNHPILNFILRFPFNLLYTKAVACGTAAGKWLFKKRKFEIIANARNIDDYSFDEEKRKRIREKIGVNKEIVIGCVGSFNNQKNHEYLIEVFDQLIKGQDNKYKLVLIGDGPLRNKISEEIKRLGLKKNVVFTGKINNVNEWLNAFDIFLLTSRYEGFPTVIVESQINGLKCLISDKITEEIKITDLVKLKSIDVPPEEWKKVILNEEIQPLIERKKYRNIMQEKGYDIEKEAMKLYNIYRREYESTKHNRNIKN